MSTNSRVPGGPVPEGPVPEFRYSGSNEAVPPEHWRLLSRPATNRIPKPKPTTTEGIKSRPIGKPSLGRTEWYVERIDSSIDDYGYDEIVNSQWGWRVHNFQEMENKARGILREAGFHFEMNPGMNYLFKCRNKRWWVIDNNEQSLIEPSDEIEWFGFHTDHIYIDDIPRNFFDDMNGEFGPLAWAFKVIECINSKRRRENELSRRASNVAALLGSSSWLSMEKNVDESLRPELIDAIEYIKYQFTGGGNQSDISTAFKYGFNFGKSENIYSTESAYSEERSNKRTKNRLRNLIKNFVIQEWDYRGRKPYVVAKYLLNQKYLKTELGIELTEAGLVEEEGIGSIAKMVRDEIRKHHESLKQK